MEDVQNNTQADLNKNTNNTIIYIYNYELISYDINYTLILYIS